MGELVSIEMAPEPMVKAPVGDAIKSSVTFGDTVNDSVYAPDDMLAVIVVSAALEVFIGTKIDDAINVTMNAVQKIGAARRAICEKKDDWTSPECFRLCLNCPPPQSVIYHFSCLLLFVALTKVCQMAH